MDVEARQRFAAEPVAVLGTTGPAGPHLVPVTFVVEGEDGDATIWTAVDGKPKRSAQLRRLANVVAEPSVSLLAQHWDDDWSRLWWVRADGVAAVIDDAITVARIGVLLRGKYPQYEHVAIGGPLIAVRVETWRGWAAIETLS